MRVSIVFFIVGVIFQSSPSFAQDQIQFKVITYSENITIGDSHVWSGMDVVNSDKVISIPKNGYLGIITSMGETARITETLRVNQVNKSIERFLTNPVLKPSGSVQRGGSDFSLLFSIEIGGYHEVVGDSVFIFWISRNDSYRYTYDPKDFVAPKQGPYKFIFQNLRYEEVVSKTTPNNFIATPIPFEYDLGFSFWVLNQSNKEQSYNAMIGEASPGKKLTIGKQVTVLPIQDYQFYQCAVYDINNLRVDRNMSIYRILSKKHTTDDPIFLKYFEGLAKRYRFDLIEGLK